jgi:hypothetical protein
MHATELLVSEQNYYDVEIAIKNLKQYESASVQIPA